VITERLICGVATIFGQRAHDGRVWYREEFDAFLRMEMAVPVRLDHGAILDSHGGIMSIGRAWGFRPVSVPVADRHIDGLLALAVLDSGPWQDAILRDIQQHLDQPALPPWGFSFGARRIPNESCLPHELSLTQRPGYADALILATGEDAMITWRLLTEAPVQLKNVARPGVPYGFGVLVEWG
jgi:hypothetical protein